MTFSNCSTAITQIQFRNISSPKDPLCPFVALIPIASPRHPLIYFLSLHIYILPYISDKWNHEIRDLFCPASLHSIMFLRFIHIVASALHFYS